jgi:hypothetical protein
MKFAPATVPDCSQWSFRLCADLEIERVRSWACLRLAALRKFTLSKTCVVRYRKTTSSDRGRLNSCRSASRNRINSFPHPRIAAMLVGVFLLGSHSILSADDPFVLWDPNQKFPTAADCSLVKNVGFVVVKRREPHIDGYNWLHGAAIVRHHDRFFASFGHNLGNENTASEVANGRVSRDGGRTWGPLFTIDDGNTDNPAVSHGVFLSHQDELWAFQGAFTGRMQQVHTRAYQLDETTNQWRYIGIAAERGFWPMQEPQKMGDGNWIMSGISVGNGYGGADDPAAVAISTGEDPSRWQVITIPKPHDMVMWGESTVIVDDAEILNISRWGRPVALAAVSKDYGRTWTEMRPTNLPMAGSKPYAGKLSNGQRYLIGTTTADSGNRRSPLTIAVSRPGERLFCKVFRIRDAIHQGPGESHAQSALSYPYAIEHDGKLFIIYSNDGARGGNRNSAELAIVPLESLTIAAESAP